MSVNYARNFRAQRASSDRSSTERVAGFRRGQEAAEAEQARRPRRIRDDVLAPGSQPVSGGILAPGVQPR
jgi:hypothetical protein